MHEKNLNAHQVLLAPHALRFLSEGLLHREEIQPPVKSTVMVTIHVGISFIIMLYRVFRFDLLSWIHEASALLF